MKKIGWILIAVVLLVVPGAYLNRAYAHIFSEIGAAHLASPDKSYSYALAGSSPSDATVTYVAMGDSLTAGVGTDDYAESYPYLVAQKMADTNNIVLEDLGRSGFTSGEVKTTLLAQAVADRPDVVTVLVGINDIHDNVPSATFKENYQTILSSLQQQTHAKIYAVSIPYLGSNRLMLPPYNYYYDLKTSQFNAIIKGIAKADGIPYIDIYTPSKPAFASSDTYYSSDFFHPSTKGYTLWAGIIYDDIRT